MRTVLIDNYDSFTYILAHLIAEALGSAPDVFYNDDISWEDLIDSDYDAVIISPGPGHPERPNDFGICERIVKDFEGPILGVCLGHQGIAHHAGAIVDLAPAPMHGRTSEVRHNGTGLFKNVPPNFEVVRYHSLLVNEAGPDIEVTAWTPDGLAMGLRHTRKPQWGVQFHPESICSEYGLEIIRNFRDLASEFFAASTKNTKTLSSDESVYESPPTKTSRFTRKSPLKLFWREIANWVDPEDCFSQIFSESADAFWLDGTQTAHGMGRYSYMGDATGPHSELIAYDVRERELQIDDHSGTRVENISLFDYLNNRLEKLGMQQPAGYQPPFVGGYAGYFGYELKEDCGASKGARSPHPDARLIFADRFIAFDNLEKRMWVACLDEPANVERAKGWLTGVISSLEGIRQASPPDPEAVTPMVFRPNQSRPEYAERIREAKHEIRHGETYEVCLTNEFVAKGSPDPLNAYRLFRRKNPAPYASYLKFCNSAILSCSPERFIKIDHQGVVESKPIKGTAKRGATKEEDAQIAEALRNSEKDRSENLMIVDLLRNDLARVCKLGSVHVPKLFAIETYKSVHQLVSTIRGTLRDDLSSVDCVRSAFPGGSMTGAPKIRTMEIIDRLENRARGIYSGSIGFVSLTGAVDLNIVIRTAVVADGKVTIGAGGAIVDLSDVEAECDEVWLKARALLMALNSYENSLGTWVESSSTERRAPTTEPSAPINPSQVPELATVRAKIDEVDGQLLKLLASRFEITTHAAELKIANNLPMMQTDRVRLILDRIAQRAADEKLDGEFGRTVWRTIIQEACRREIDMRGGMSGNSTSDKTSALLRDSAIGCCQTIKVNDVERTANILRDRFGFEIERSNEGRPTGRTNITARAGVAIIELIKRGVRPDAADEEPQEVVVEVRGLGLLEQDLLERGASLTADVDPISKRDRLVAELEGERLRILFREDRPFEAFMEQQIAIQKTAAE